jgi:hypothetical protein
LALSVRLSPSASKRKESDGSQEEEGYRVGGERLFSLLRGLRCPSRDNNDLWDDL